ncbi:hypothetical protein HK405_009521, partial [Cladochytrium tenue]
MQYVAETVLNILGTFVVVIYAVPWVALLAVVLIPLFYSFLRLFRAAMRELKRLESIARSPLYAQINETFTGLSTIRAYGAVDRFKAAQEQLQDIANQPTYIRNTVDSWMSVRTEGCMAFIIASVAFVGFATNINSALLGLSLSYSLTLTSFFNIGLRNFADLESRMNCVERLWHYATDLPQEARGAASGSPAAPPPSGWPSAGALSFDSVTMRYRPDLPPVLRGLSFAARPAERVGVVGRTGAGKSSLVAALFRLVDFTAPVANGEGKILVDGVDIAELALPVLRNAIAIIPQSPILF